MSHFLRGARVGAALCAALVLNATAAAAETTTWPDKPVTFIIPFPAGGSIDAVMRAISPQLSERLGQTVVIENVGGASGSIGAGRVAQAKPDGTTLLAGSINDVVLQPLVNSHLRYGTDDFEPVSLVFTSPVILVARKDLPQSNIDEVVQALRADPESLSYGSPGQGTFQHVVIEDLQRRTTTKMLHVPYKGAAPLVNDLLGGQIDMAVMAPPTALPHLQQGRIKSLGVISGQRLSAYPDLPTINESGAVQGMEMTGWVGVLAPKGVPPERLQRVRDALAAVMETPAVRERVQAMGMESATSYSKASFDTRIRDDLSVLRALNLTIQP
ncbi:tripartite tricarboxylate transporter substrate binding protein [Achromobacter sp. NFACC18-2]|uniref:Bug family tripartite tricarboxylate transporter substrate binding protein n=1 Tax=Achromobacter sp. NFACC18-2 TaxID=1564112 RepID=UPI0008B8A4D9|nr:tripartite tricarboxylate transporter substrate binding protein [Achromobacter sp. NFACC18-2]SEJ70748.1 Tripartite-type tricarboxylate transporter, receptor component TctC [Achromobacter sp. NFACC18-2]